MTNKSGKQASRYALNVFCIDKINCCTFSRSIDIRPVVFSIKVRKNVLNFLLETHKKICWNSTFIALLRFASRLKLFCWIIHPNAIDKKGGFEFRNFYVEIPIVFIVTDLFYIGYWLRTNEIFNSHSIEKFINARFI